MTTPNPGGDGELLRDAIADEVERNFGFFGSLHGKAIPVGRETYLDIGAVAIAALRTVLREHPEAIAELVETPQPSIPEPCMKHWHGESCVRLGPHETHWTNYGFTWKERLREVQE